MANKLFLSWKWVDDQIENLAQIIEDSVSEFKYISGIPRGGLIPGAYLSHRLGLKYIPFNSALELPLSQKKEVLVVDDICDTGNTVLDASEKGFQIATLSLRYSSPFIPEFYSVKITNDDWLVFPWEKNDSDTIQDYLVNRK